MKYLLAIVLLCEVGFGQLPDNLPQLKAAAAKNHLHWMVFCTGAEDIDSSKAFMASVEVPGHGWEKYIQDGGLPGWFAYGTTQRESIANLLKAMRFGPNAIPTSKISKHHHKQCSLPLEGGPQ